MEEGLGYKWQNFIIHPKKKNEKTKQFEAKLKLFLKIMIVSRARMLLQKGMWEVKRKSVETFVLTSQDVVIFL